MAKKPTAKTKQKQSNRRGKNGGRHQNRVDESRLPFDHRQEIEQRRKARKVRSEALIQPALPTLPVNVELHCPDIYFLYTKWFESLSARAMYLDVVARQRLTSRTAFNKYLQEFDGYISEMTSRITEKLVKYEVLAKGQTTRHRKPYKEVAEVSGNRGNQLIQVFVTADNALRHLQFLACHEAMYQTKLEKELSDITNTINRLSKSMSAVVRRAKAEVAETHANILASKRRNADKVKRTRHRAKPKSDFIPADPDPVTDPDPGIEVISSSKPTTNDDVEQAEEATDALDDDAPSEQQHAAE